MIKHSKEFYVLIAITVVIPVIAFGGAYLIGETIGNHYDDSEVNDTIAMFTLKQKSYTENESVTFIHHSQYFINRSDLDSMQYGARYSCNITKYEFLDLNNSLSNCRKL